MGIATGRHGWQWLSHLTSKNGDKKGERKNGGEEGQEEKIKKQRKHSAYQNKGNPYSKAHCSKVK